MTSPLSWDLADGNYDIQRLVEHVADYVHVDEAPVRTESACNAVGCVCTELAEGRPIGGYPSCAICTHSVYSHTPRKAGRKARR